MDPEGYSLVSHEENQGKYISDVLLDKKIVNQVKNKGNLDISEKEGTESSIFHKLGRKNIVYYGTMQGEQPIKIEQANVKFQAPLVDLNQIGKRLMAIKPEKRDKIGYIHINTIQVILRSTFREGIKTPVTLTVEDNRIMEKSSKILGEIEGDLGYTTIKFCVSLQFPIPLSTKKIDNCLGIKINFKEKNLMEHGDIPLVVCYRVAYALSNSCLSLAYKNQESIYTEKLFRETSTLIKNDEINREFLRSHSTRNFVLRRLSIDLPSTSRSMLEEPTSIETIFSKNHEIEKMNKQIEELKQIVSTLNDKI